MPYLQKAWYAVAWDHELGDEPLARTLLDQPIVIFRGEGGDPHALYDACPHRFAPLSRGQVKGDRIACGYHGLEFDTNGACVRNPHGKGMIPRALAVRKFPLAKRCGMIWIWMGPLAEADEALVPNMPDLADPEFTWVHGSLHVQANYQLVIDNLLDLTHVEFLHPFLASPGNSERTEFRSEQRGDEVSAYYDVKNEPVTGLFKALWDGDETTGDLFAYMDWLPPTNLRLMNGMKPAGSDENSGPRVPVIHLLTPETEDTTHYFWAAGRNTMHGDEQVSAMLHFGTQNAFENEDEPMIRAVRGRMHSNDLFDHRPALLPIDEAAVRSRRILADLIAKEQRSTENADSLSSIE